MTRQPSREELQKQIRQLEKELITSKQVEEDLRKNQEKYRKILESIQEGYFELDLNANYTFVNDANCRFLGYSREELIGMNARKHSPSEENFEKLVQAYTHLFQTGEAIESLEVEASKKDGTKVFYETSVTLKRNSKGNPIGFQGVSRNITERKKMEIERENLIDKLKKAVSDVKQLSGMIPICASCKNIRNDKGYWEQIEVYIKDRSETEFSHGICPECIKKLYPEFCEEK